MIYTGEIVETDSVFEMIEHLDSDRVIIVTGYDFISFFVKVKDKANKDIVVMCSKNKDNYKKQDYDVDLLEYSERFIEKFSISTQDCGVGLIDASINELPILLDTVNKEGIHLVEGFKED